MLGGVYDVVEPMGSLKSRAAEPKRGFVGLHILLSVSVYIVQSRSPFTFCRLQREELERTKKRDFINC